MSTLTEMLKSKKFLAAVAAGLLVIASHAATAAGVTVDPGLIDRLFAALLTYVGAQGLADVGKSAAQISTTSTAPPSPSALPSSLPTVLAVVILATVGIGAVSSCGAKQRVAAGVEAFIDCEAPHIDAVLLDEAKSVSRSAIEKWISGDGHVDYAGLKSAAAPLKSDLMRCAFVAAVAALTAPSAPKTGAPASAPEAVDAAALRSALIQVRADLGWPQAAKLPGGVVL